MLEKYVSQAESMKKGLCNLARARYGINLEDSEDIFQDVILKIINGNGSSFRGESKFSTWFYRCFINRCMDYLGELKIRKESRLSDNGIDVDDIVNNRRVLSEDAKYDSYQIQKNIDMLDSIYGDVVRLRYWEGIKYKEIAEKLNIPIGTVKRRLNVAKRNLKKLLTENNKIKA